MWKAKRKRKRRNEKMEGVTEEWRRRRKSKTCVCGWHACMPCMPVPAGSCLLQPSPAYSSGRERREEGRVLHMPACGSSPMERLRHV